MVIHHVDGNIARLLPDFVAMGVDSLHRIEPCAGQQDIYEIKAHTATASPTGTSILPAC